MLLVGCAKSIKTDEQKVSIITNDNNGEKSISAHSERQKELKTAVQTSSYNLARNALIRGANPNEVFIDGETAISYAIKNNDINTLKVLFEFQINPNITNKEGQYPLNLAIDQEDIESIRILSNSPLIDFNIVDKEDNPPLIKALLLKNKQIALYLISKKVDLWKKSSQGEFADEVAYQLFGESFSLFMHDLRMFSYDNTRSDSTISMIQSARSQSFIYLRLMYKESKSIGKLQFLIDALLVNNPNKKLLILESLFKLFKFKDEDLYEVLFRLVKSRDLDIFSNILKNFKTFNPNTLDKNNRNFLSYAAENIDYEFSNYLRKEGAETFYELDSGDIIDSCTFLPKKKWSTRRVIKDIEKLLGC